MSNAPARSLVPGASEIVDVDDNTLDVGRSGSDSLHSATASSERRSPPSPDFAKSLVDAHRRGTPTPRPEGDRGGSEKKNMERIPSTTTIGSDPGCYGRPRTVNRDTSSLPADRSEEDDVCHPLQNGQTKGRLCIDFNYLEILMTSEKRRQSSPRVFPSLLPTSITSKSLLRVSGDREHTNIQAGQSPLNGADAGNGFTDICQGRADASRFSFFSTARDSTIYAAEFGDLAPPGEDIRQLFSFPKEDSDGFWWLNMENPTGEEVQAICNAFGIHPLTIEDITTQESREKFELFPSYYFACFRSPGRVVEADGIDYTPFNVYAVVFREGTISFSFVPNTHASHVRSRMATLKEHVQLSSDWVCYALIDDIVDSFAPAIDEIERKTDIIEDQVFTARLDDDREFIRRTDMARKDIICVMRLLGGKADVLRSFIKRCNEDYDLAPRMDMGLYLGDIQDHVITMTNNLIHFEKIISRSHSNYLAQLSIDSLNQGDRANDLLKRVTIIAALFMAGYLIFVLFGMNVRVPWQDIDNINAFLGITGSFFLFALVCLLIAKWLRLF